MSTAVRRGIYGKLAGDTTLNNLLAPPATGFSKSIYYQEPPQGAQYPFVIFNDQSDVDTWAMNDPQALNTMVWLVKALDRNTSADPADAIAERIMVLLNDASLSISGVNHLFLRRQSGVRYPETSDGVQFKHSGGLYRLVTD